MLIGVPLLTVTFTVRRRADVVRGVVGLRTSECAPFVGRGRVPAPRVRRGRVGRLQHAVEQELDLRHADVVARVRGDADVARDGRAVRGRGDRGRRRGRVAAAGGVVVQLDELVDEVAGAAGVGVLVELHAAAATRARAAAGDSRTISSERVPRRAARDRRAARCARPTRAAPRSGRRRRTLGALRSV